MIFRVELSLDSTGKATSDAYQSTGLTVEEAQTVMEYIARMGYLPSNLSILDTSDFEGGKNAFNKKLGRLSENLSVLAADSSKKSDKNFFYNMGLAVTLLQLDLNSNNLGIYFDSSAGGDLDVLVFHTRYEGDRFGISFTESLTTVDDPYVMQSIFLREAVRYYYLKTYKADSKKVSCENLLIESTNVQGAFLMTIADYIQMDNNRWKLFADYIDFYNLSSFKKKKIAKEICK